MTFVQEEIVVVELHSVHAVISLKHVEYFRGSFRRFDLLPSVEDRHYAAELAAERATDAGVMHTGAAAQEGGEQVTFDGSEAMIRQPREVIRGAERTLGIVNVQAEGVLEG